MQRVAFVLVTSAAIGSLGCVEQALDRVAAATTDTRGAAAAAAAADGDGTTTVCAARSARGTCTEWVEHETVEARWLRETQEERDRQQAYREGEPFFGHDVAGESAEERVRRMDEERRRQDAYRKGEPFFPDHRAGEPAEGYVHRMDEERRRQDAYRKGEPFFPDASRR